MFKKQTISKFLLVSISLLVGLLLGACVIAGTAKSANAQTSTSNDFSLIFECSPEYNLIGAYEEPEGGKQLDYEDNVKSFDYWSFLCKWLEKAGITEYYIDFDSAYYKFMRPMMTNDNDIPFVLSVYFDVYANVGGEWKTFDAGAQIAPAKAPEQPSDVPWLLNGMPIGTPTENQPLLDQNNVFKATDTLTVTIAGNVVDTAGNAIDGAKVSLTPENVANAVVPEPVMTVNGTFVFENVDSEILPAILNIEKEGYTFVPVRITEDDIVDGNIVLQNLTLDKVPENVTETETAKTMDLNYYLIFALMMVVVSCCGIAYTNRVKNHK